MAEYGEWTQKGATLSDLSAESEYGLAKDFIVKAIRSGKVEYRDSSIWGNPSIKLLRSQLEAYITKELGKGYLAKVKHETELKRIKSEISRLKKKLKELDAGKIEIESCLSGL